jgi:hypothetical protein
VTEERSLGPSTFLPEELSREGAGIVSNVEAPVAVGLERGVTPLPGALRVGGAGRSCFGAEVGVGVGGRGPT